MCPAAEAAKYAGARGMDADAAAGRRFLCVVFAEGAVGVDLLAVYEGS